MSGRGIRSERNDWSYADLAHLAKDPATMAGHLYSSLLSIRPMRASHVVEPALTVEARILVLAERGEHGDMVW